MRKTTILLTCVLLLSLSGCAVQDWVFAAFSDNYSAGGISQYEKQDHFNREIERGKSIGQNGSEVISDVPWH